MKDRKMKMNKFGFIAALLLGGLVTKASSRPLNVVATTPELGSLAAAIGGQHVKVRTITSGREDPHFLQARPTFMVMARDADLWIRIGMDLEVGWEPLLIEGSRNARIRVGEPGHFDAGQNIAYVLDVPDATASRAMGDVHADGNPHYMLDPLNARQIATALAERLKKNDAANAAHYDDSLKAFLARLDQAMFGEALVQKLGGESLWTAAKEGTLDSLLADKGATAFVGGWVGSMAAYKGKPVMTFHKSWVYFAHRFGLRIVAQLEPLPGVPPSPAHLARVVEIAKAQNVKLVLQEPFYPAGPARLIEKQAGTRVAAVSSYATDASADGYFNWMDSVVAAFANH